jgi:lactoylglutathione lyase
MTSILVSESSSEATSHVSKNESYLYDWFQGIDELGDQFLALQKGRKQSSDDGRHFGLVVDDKDAVRRALAEAGVEMLPGPFLDFRDPWGNRIEIVGYDNVQFSKAPNVLRGMGLAHLSKNAMAIKELAEKGMAPD